MDKDNSGVLFTVKEKTNEKGPDRTGNVVLSKELLSQLTAAVKAGGVAKISLSAWENESKAGNKYLGLRASIFKEKAAADDDLFSK